MARVTLAFRPGFGPVLVNLGWPTGTTYPRFLIPWLAQWLGNGQGQPCFQSRLWSSFGQTRLACWSQLLPILFLFFFSVNFFIPWPAMTLASRLGFDPGFPRSGWAPDARENLKFNEFSNKQQGLKKLEIQLVLWASSSHIWIFWGHFLLVLVNDFVSG